jgi:hypothetical protein
MAHRVDLDSGIALEWFMIDRSLRILSALGALLDA